MKEFINWSYSFRTQNAFLRFRHNLSTAIKRASLSETNKGLLPLPVLYACLVSFFLQHIIQQLMLTLYVWYDFFALILGTEYIHRLFSFNFNLKYNESQCKNLTSNRMWQLGIKTKVLSLETTKTEIFFLVKRLLFSFYWIWTDFQPRVSFFVARGQFHQRLF